ncbi:hypothetical protein C0J52_07422 [Blattella germanica]|nr:hypothetical protein C0J52_07422 [Blattella germanica]
MLRGFRPLTCFHLVIGRPTLLFPLGWYSSKICGNLFFGILSICSNQIALVSLILSFILNILSSVLISSLCFFV